MPTATAQRRSNVKTKPKAKSLYSVHPGVAMVQKWIAELPDKTGRSLEQWLKFIKKEGPADEKSRREWLKAKHKLGTNTAWWLAERASADPNRGFAEEDPREYLRMASKYVDDMFTGGKAALRPIYDKLLSIGLAIGSDSKACPCQTIVPLYRNHVFAQIKPTTNTRIDLGFALGPMIKQGKKIPSGARLLDTGGFAKKDRITHRIPITTLKDIDDDVKKWLKIAYDLDAKD
jgi:hypothetical protein